MLRTTYNMFDENGNIKNMPVNKKKPVITDDDSDDFIFDF